MLLVAASEGALLARSFYCAACWRNTALYATHLPLDIVGEHAEEDVGAYPAFEAMVHQAGLQMDGLAWHGMFNAGVACCRIFHNHTG